MTKNSYEQVSFPIKNEIHSSKLASKTTAGITIAVSWICFLSFIVVNFFYDSQMMDWSIRASESMIQYDSSNLSK